MNCPFPNETFGWCSCAYLVDADTVGPVVLPDGDMLLLPPGLTDAVAKRRCEFLAGRYCAALALQAIDAPMQVGRNGRSPVWPEEIRGSITHAGGNAIAVASRQHKFLGIDLEPIMSADIAGDLHSTLVTDSELSIRPASLSLAEFVTLVFSAKEAFYKAVSHTLARIPDFHEVAVVDVTAEQIVVRFEKMQARGRWQIRLDGCLVLFSVRE